MDDHDGASVSRDDPSEEGDLDLALRAAFGDETAIAGDGRGVLHDLERQLGVHSRVMLREESVGDSPLIDPHPSDATPTGGPGRYEVIGEIARGGVGVILKGRDRDLGRDVALKILQPQHLASPAMVQRFVEEAQIAGQLQHPGILPVYEFGLQADRRPYFTMKLVKGRTLAGLLASREQVDHDRPRFFASFQRVCQTIAYAHSRGVIHRDIKPSNIMIGAFGEVQVVDWGLAKVLGASDTARARDEGGDSGDETQIETLRSTKTGSHSMTGSVMGTPAYMAPEQARGDVERVDERADVFALGAILCEILTGAPPYRIGGRDVLGEAAAARLDDAWDRLQACGADDQLLDLVRSCLAPRLESRPRSAGVVSDEFTAYLASVDERARASDLAAATARARAAEERRARRLTAALAASVVLAVVVGGAAYIRVQDLRQQRVIATSNQVNEALVEARRLLDEARATPVADQTSWIAMRAAGMQFAALEGAGEVDDATRERADAFLMELSQADLDRQMVERIEELVIIGATHEEEESWHRMEGALREAFADFGIDVLSSDDEVAAAIRRSNVSPALADGYELWLATSAHLVSFGSSPYSMEALVTRMEVLYEADPDPFRTAVRRQIWSGRPDLERLRELAASDEFDPARPRTQSWLASAFAMAGDEESMCATFERALRIHPSDFMLNFDYAYHLSGLLRWDESILYYNRALAIRPESGGMWRKLAIALRERSEPDLDEAVEALRQSLRFQPDYAPTHADLGLTYLRAGDPVAAEASCRRAVDLDANLAIAHCSLGLALQEQGRFDEALAALVRGHELGASGPMWTHPSATWIERCRELMAGSS